MARRRPYVHSPEPEEGEQPWTIHIGLKPLDPDDPTFVSPKRPNEDDAANPAVAGDTVGRNGGGTREPAARPRGRARDRRRHSS
jgi:hypothetical protein